MVLPLCRSRTLCVLASLLLSPFSLLGVPEAARFDLSGPRVQVHVTRDGKTLPIATVPNLKGGDQLWVHADLPETQSVKYLLVVIFLRGTTNPPPESWFTRIETWNKRVNREGVSVTVPDEAQQALVLLAPETGGDFSALRSAVRGHPGVFVRASQDLAEAGFEQARIEKYLNEIRTVPPGDPKALAQHSDLLARTLNLKPNADCFSRPVEQQYNCLTQSGTQNLLDDGHGQSIVASLTSGASSDLIATASATSLAGGGVYSAYVGAVVDVVRIMGSLHTAHYAYIPAIAFPEQDNLNLRLNTPPSFQNPKSVIVIGLPAIQTATPPPLRAADAKHVTCLLEPNVALPVEGAPLVFSTSFAHDISLRLDGQSGVPELPLQPDAFQGGLVVRRATDRKPLGPADPVTAARGALEKGAPAAPIQEDATVHGLWGFDPFSGPTLPVQNAPGAEWKFMPAENEIIVGQQNHVLLTSSGTACIESVTADDLPPGEQKLVWKPGDKANTVDVSLTLKSSNPGALRLSVHQYGKEQPDSISAQTFSKPAELKAIEYHADDRAATLTGMYLRQVQKVEFAGHAFSAGEAQPQPVAGSASGETTLSLSETPSDEVPRLKPGDHLEARITLADGRLLTLPTTVKAQRPMLAILNKRADRTSPSAIQVLNPNDVPLDSRLILSFRSADAFPRDAAIEITSEDLSLHHELTIAAGSLVLLDRHTVLANIDLRKTFGESAFGPLSVRLVTHGGGASDLQPLVTLVRLPTLTELHCSQALAEQPCTLSGGNLYLIKALAGDEAFAHSVDVPDGFVSNSLNIPRPAGALLYLKLRDDPSSVVSANLPVTP